MSLLREPLVHFLLAAAVIVAVDAWLVVPRERTVRVTAASVQARVREREAVLGRPLAALEREEIARNLADDEILRREAVERGFDRSGQVRSLLIQRMRSLLAADPPEPTESELRAWYAASPDRFGRPARTDFDQVFFGPDSEIPADLLDRLEEGVEFWTLGDPLGPAASVRGVSDRELRLGFGAAFADGLLEAPADSWWGPVESTRGTHFVRIRQRTPVIPVPFEDAAHVVREDWRRERSEESIRLELDVLRKRYRIIIEAAE